MFGFSQYNIPMDGFLPMVIEDKVQDVQSPDSAIFDLIFSVDPLTGLPCDVVQQYLSDKTSADVKEFIERTFKDIDSPDVSIAPEQIHKEYSSLSDSLVADLSRNRFESVEQYEERIQDFLRQNKADVYRDKILKEMKSNKNES